MLCTSTLFPDCVCAIVHCPTQAEAIGLRRFIKERPLLGKYQLESALFTTKADVDTYCNFDVQKVPQWEERAENPLIQYIKTSTPLEFDGDLLRIVYTGSIPLLMKAFHEKWKGGEDVEESKCAHNAIPIPNPEKIATLTAVDEKFATLRSQFIHVTILETDFEVESANSRF